MSSRAASCGQAKQHVAKKQGDRRSQERLDFCLTRCTRFSRSRYSRSWKLSNLELGIWYLESLVNRVKSHDYRVTTTILRLQVFIFQAFRVFLFWRRGLVREILREIVGRGVSHCRPGRYEIWCQATKGARWMPWDRGPMKDVVSDDTPRGAAIEL